ncbi:hypothetical protein [Ramlibacter sp.]|uniref:hypothetical protein n=1 Tax=Ramlibacter sp. TaxID=1917967 RepID=UPI003D0B2E9E
MKLQPLGLYGAGAGAGSEAAAPPDGAPGSPGVQLWPLSSAGSASISTVIVFSAVFVQVPHVAVIRSTACAWNGGSYMKRNSPLASVTPLNGLSASVTVTALPKTGAPFCVTTTTCSSAGPAGSALVEPAPFNAIRSVAIGTHALPTTIIGDGHTWAVKLLLHEFQLVEPMFWYCQLAAHCEPCSCATWFR